VADLASVSGVLGVFPDTRLQLDTDRSPAFIGATRFWQRLGGQAEAGEGVIVGVLDTGIWPEHPSFSDPDPQGNAYPAPPPPLSGTRQCEFSGGANPGPAFACNNKLIGADDRVYDGARRQRPWHAYVEHRRRQRAGGGRYLRH
jgi:hypothetical protein